MPRDRLMAARSHGSSPGRVGRLGTVVKSQALDVGVRLRGIRSCLQMLRETGSCFACHSEKALYWDEGFEVA